MRIVKTLELNEDQMHLLILNGMGMTKQEICDATGRGEAEVTASITEALTGWKTEILAPEKECKEDEVVELPESDSAAERREEWVCANLASTPQLVPQREYVERAYPGRRPYTALLKGVPATQLEADSFALRGKGMTLQEIANKLGKTKCSVKMALQRLAKKQEALAGVSREKRGTNQHCQPYRQTKEGIKITEFEHRFAKLYAKGEHNLAQMAEALGVKLQAIHDARYKLRGKLGIQDDIEFNYALRAIAEL